MTIDVSRLGQELSVSDASGAKILNYFYGSKKENIDKLYVQSVYDQIAKDPTQSIRLVGFSSIEVDGITLSTSFVDIEGVIIMDGGEQHPPKYVLFAGGTWNRQFSTLGSQAYIEIEHDGNVVYDGTTIQSKVIVPGVYL